MQIFSHEVTPSSKNAPQRTAFYHEKTKTFRKWLKTPRIEEKEDTNQTRTPSIELVSLAGLNAPTMWKFLYPTHELMQNSLTLNPQPYVTRATFIASQRNDVKSILLTRQKLRCGICAKPLIDWDAVFK